MFKTRLVLMSVLVAFVMASVQAVVLDDMDNIAARPWTDDRDTQGQARPGWMSQGAGVMKIDYGVTNDSAGIPDPASGWDYLGNWVGVGGPGAAFTSADGNVGGFNADNYAGDFDRVPSAPFSPLELGILTTNHVFILDVFKTIANSPEHVRELQLYDSLGNRNTYQVQAEATARITPQGWTTYCVPLCTPLENNADLTDIVTVKLWVSAWSAYPTASNPAWPDDYVVVPRTGTPVLIDNMRLELVPTQLALDNMDNIAARPWTDDRDTEGQARPGWMSQSCGTGSMKIDYGVTNDSAGVPDPASGWDYMGNWIGVGGSGAAFTSSAGNVGGFNADNYAGDFDRVPTAPFTFAELGVLTTDHVFLLDVYKTVANSPEHVRELQLYDSLGNRNTYQVQAEGTASAVGAGWKTYFVPLSSPLENNADLTDIVTIKLWVSAWSAYPTAPNPAWPDDYVVVPRTGTPVLIDNLRLVRQVDVDVKPGQNANPLRVNFTGEGVLPVAILGSADFDVLNVDVATITLEGIAPIRSSFKDVSTFDGEGCAPAAVGPDGFLDLTLKFSRQEILDGIAGMCGVPNVSEIPHRTRVPLNLKAMLMDTDFEIEGTDCVTILNRGLIKRKK